MSSAQISRLLRKKSTWAEKKLWAILRDRRFSAYKFRRQHQVGEHILDFYCAEARYNLELDGGQHGFPEQQTKDIYRDAYLKSRYIVTRRFWNPQLKDVRFVRDTIWNDLQSRALHPGNAQPEKRMRLPTRLKDSGDSVRSHPSPRPSPR
ncbi:MAG TPA: endonuclease domain-containing protein [Verrucomicrobiae bacterium]|nr:endonuclease domain-containing protein [Verrucomicrobiae bacterium]